jgi:hypothetical protein
LQPYDRRNLTPNHPLVTHPGFANFVPTLPLIAITKNHPLAVLQHLTNTDKHRTFQFGFVLPGVVLQSGEVAHDCVITHARRVVHGALQEGAEWACFDVIPTGPHPRVDMNQTVSLAIGFGDMRNAFAELARIGNEVDRIIGIFEGAF